MTPAVVSLCDYSGVMVQPWLDAGYPCVTVDLRHPAGVTTDGLLTRIGCDVRDVRQGDYWWPSRIAIVFAFPPCTNLAVSGARWFRSKGLRGLIAGLEIVEACRDICESSGAPSMLENPVSTLSTYWRKPDYTFQPWHYGDNERKKTCIWADGGFVMPPQEMIDEPADVRQSVWRMAPSPNRGDLRSVTFPGFARAVFVANHPHVQAKVA